MESDNISKYFEILGLDSSATYDEIKKKYLELVKEYHPDRFINEDLEMQETAKQIFIDVHKAYKRLINIYNNENQSTNNLDENKIDDKEYAKRFYLKGLKFYKSYDLNSALDCFISARRLYEDNLEYHRMIVRCLLNKPRRIYEAKEISMELIKKEPFNPENYFLVGEIYRQAGIYETAKHYYDKALKLGANKNKINKSLELINKSNEKKSFINKLFSKKNL